VAIFVNGTNNVNEELAGNQVDLIMVGDRLLSSQARPTIYRDVFLVNRI
jgi:hypothetical protein